jgi:hypothetical protein
LSLFVFIAIFLQIKKVLWCYSYGWKISIKQ